MIVDFRWKRAPAMRVATHSWRGSWKESRIRAEFEKIVRWAEGQGVPTGRWVLVMPAPGRFQVAVEVRRAVRGRGPIKVRTWRATKVASIEFDPDQISAEVAYHGITDWLRWRKKEREIKVIGNYREVYSGDPWKNPKAWAHTEIQVVVR